MRKYLFCFESSTSLEAGRRLWGCNTVYASLPAARCWTRQICSSKPSFSDGLYEKERLFFSLCCGKPPQGQLLVCSLDRAMDFQGSLPTKQTAEFHFITSATGWSLNRAGEGAPPSSHLCSALYLTQPTCGTGGDLGGKQLDSIFQ